MPAAARHHKRRSIASKDVRNEDEARPARVRMLALAFENLSTGAHL
jgi:hypothetical protein